jgi:hypothetical protein
MSLLSLLLRTFNRHAQPSIECDGSLVKRMQEYFSAVVIIVSPGNLHVRITIEIALKLRTEFASHQDKFSASFARKLRRTSVKGFKGGRLDRRSKS